MSVWRRSLRTGEWSSCPPAETAGTSDRAPLRRCQRQCQQPTQSGIRAGASRWRSLRVGPSSCTARGRLRRLSHLRGRRLRLLPRRLRLPPPQPRSK